jgi:hypothetical protein
MRDVRIGLGGLISAISARFVGVGLDCDGHDKAKKFYMMDLESPYSHITALDASSIKLSSPKPTRATEPATVPAIKP